MLVVLGVRAVGLLWLYSFRAVKFSASCFRVLGPWCFRVLGPSGLDALRLEGFIASGFRPLELFMAFGSEPIRALKYQGFGDQGFFSCTFLKAEGY